MNHLKLTFLVLILTSFSGYYMTAQTVQYEILFNESTCLYEAHIHIEGDIMAPSNNLGPSGFTIAVPAQEGKEILSVVSVQPPQAGWADQTPVFGEGNPDFDYHKVTTNGAMFTQTLSDGADITLFTFALDNDQCMDGIRVFENDVDQNPVGLDYSNSFQVLLLRDIYNGNRNNSGIELPKPNVRLEVDCNVNAFQLFADVDNAYADCLSDLTFQWSGPNNFSSSEQNPMVQVNNPAAQKGNYIVEITDGKFCSIVESVEVDESVCSSVFPSIFTDFEAKKKFTTAVLNWTISNASHLDYFAVQHSTDNTTFSTLGNVQSKNNNVNFKYTHYLPTLGMNYYRIKYVSDSGQVEYSEVEAVDFSLFGGWWLEIYPNPATERINVSLDSGDTNMELVGGEVVVFDKLGQEVYKNDLQNNMSIDISNLTKGFYFATIKAADGTLVTSQKFIKL